MLQANGPVSLESLETNLVTGPREVQNLLLVKE
jgi:hypothetical protein